MLDDVILGQFGVQSCAGDQYVDRDAKVIASGGHQGVCERAAERLLVALGEYVSSDIDDVNAGCLEHSHEVAQLLAHSGRALLWFKQGERPMECSGETRESRTGRGKRSRAANDAHVLRAELLEKGPGERMPL
jgi:hypothetical protein